jgi:purine nucleosidase
MKHVIVDFDNTMGVAGCDTDDGLALLYLLGKPEEVTVEGLCCTYGNSDVDTVVGNTRRICRELGLGMPVFKGGASALDPTSDAARFMAEAVAKRPGEISILATGSLTNLRGAAQLNPDFFSQVREIAIMGGITETLLVNGRMLDELNLSCDAQASCQVLGAACPVIDATAQACLPAVFTKDRFAREMGGDSWLMRQAEAWFDFMTVGYDMDGFVCWDIVAAAALVEPALFDMETLDVTLNPRILQVGYIEHAPEGAPSSTIAIPHIKDAEAFRTACFSAWKRALA